ncbi:MAG: hypothetical protein QOJ32_685, partial [Frankiaceae bacterium]|nr:hypothetical protein [Frankiaceae bacterium]
MTSDFGVPRGAVPEPSPEPDPLGLAPSAAQIEGRPDHLLGRLDALIDAGACWKPALSPDGRLVAFIADDADCPQLFLSRLGLWAPRQITFGPHEVVDLSWSRDGGLIGYAVAPNSPTAQLGGTQLYVVDADGRSPRPMFVAHNESAFAGVWTRTARGFAFSTTLGSTRGECTAYLLDLTESTLLPLARAQPGDGHVTVTDVSADRSRSLLQYGAAGGARVTLVDRSVARRVPLTPPHALLDGATVLDVSQPRFDASARNVFTQIGVERNGVRRRALAAVALDEVGDPEAWQLVAERDDADLAFYSLAGDRSVAVLVWDVDGCTALEIWTLGGERRPVVLSTAGTIRTVSVDETGTFAVFDLSGPQEPSTLWRLDVGTGQVARLGLPPGSSPPQGGLITPAFETIDAGPHQPLEGWLFRPLAHRRTGVAVVVLPDDASSAGPPAYSALHQALLDIGIAVFVPRPSADLDLPGEVERVQELAATLLDAGIVEAGMLGAYGVAHGGWLVAASSAAAPHLFGAAVDVCGSDGLDGLLPLASEYRAREAGTGSPGGARTPTLVVHG